MKLKSLYLLLLLLGEIILATNCSNEENITPKITLNAQSSILQVGSKGNSDQILAFTATHPWQASIDCEWIALSPKSGPAGEASIHLLTKENNLTGEERTATLLVTLPATNIRKAITIRQSSISMLDVAQTSYSLTSEKQDIEILFTTNLASPNLQISPVASTDLSWITLKSNNTKALQEGKVTLAIQNNATHQPRSASFVLQVMFGGIEMPVQSSTITINQEATPIETSTDYSADKQVTQLQKHTLGKGIPLVFMGDGFLDKDIESGRYRQVMEKAMQNFFTEEPIKSLQAYFDVWYINAVSASNSFGNHSTCFDCRLERGGSTLIEGDHQTVIEYALEIPEFQIQPELLNEATCIVVLNTEEYAGTCYFGFNDNTNITNLAIGYCPMIYGLEDDMFRRVLCHECVGHGFAKLLDEYSYQEYGAIPRSEIISIQNQQQTLGWAANVDFTYDKSRVLWNQFLQDERYQNADNYGEILGVYTGACTYWSGAYRPTEESMMRSNIHGFNAPSREAIYKRVMSTAHDDNWTYTYDEFTTFDLAHLPTPIKITTRASDNEMSRPFSPPQFTNMDISNLK